MVYTPLLSFGITVKWLIYQALLVEHKVQLAPFAVNAIEKSKWPFRLRDRVLTCHFKTDMRNLTNSGSSTRKFKKIALSLAPSTTKYIMFELRKVQRSYVLWHWRLMQNLKEKWLVLSKMIWGIWQICIGWNKWVANLTKLFTHV